jgi:hypothetical protein
VRSRYWKLAFECTHHEAKPNDSGAPDPLALVDSHLSCTLAVGVAGADLHAIRQTSNPFCALSSIDLWVFTVRARVPSHCAKTPTHEPVETYVVWLASMRPIWARVAISRRVSRDSDRDAFSRVERWDAHL